MLGFRGNQRSRGDLPREQTLSKLPNKLSTGSLSSGPPDPKLLKFSWELYKRIKQRILQAHLKPRTRRSYHRTWVRMNKFLSEFDRLPPSWDDRMVLWAVHLADNRKFSATISSYMSAIRHVLAMDGIFVSRSNFQLAMIIRASKIHNDQLYIRLPIQQRLHNRILLHVKEELGQNRGQHYLSVMLRAAFSLAYFGLMRISEVSKSDHAVKGQDINYRRNKRRITIYLRSSKTHSASDKPQIIHIQGNRNLGENCPYSLITEYVNLRGRRASADREQFLLNFDGSPVTGQQLRANLKFILEKLNYDETLYDFHSYRIGCSTDLKKQGKPISFIQKEGRWKCPNSVLKYVRI